MSLKKFIKQENMFDTFFTKEPAFPENPAQLTGDQKLQLAKRLLSALSPESLTCDGELRGTKLLTKARMLNQAKADLEALGQKVEEEPYTAYV
jgi:hypothetical protein